MMLRRPETHFSARSGWLRAAVLGANDGIVSTASLIIGIAAAQGSQSDIMLAGLAGLMAGAMSMAAGEYVSVSSQSDIEKADLDRERKELQNNAEFEHYELAAIYRQRGLDAELANQVARQLMAHDALAAHARDELGFTEQLSARPLQAAVTSALTFASGALLPILLVMCCTLNSLTMVVVATGSLLSLAGLGALAARVGGAAVLPATARVVFWGAMAMIATAAVGSLFGVNGSAI